MKPSRQEHAAADAATSTGEGIGVALARFAASANPDRFPESARQVLEMSLLDWFAVAVAGRNEPVSRIVRDLVLAEEGRRECGVIGSDRRVPARAAALSNGTSSHALDYDDTHFDYTGHPSAAVVPATLALAERLSLDGRAFLDATLVGVEVACRLGAWLGPDHYQAGFHQTATTGSFGAAAAACRLLRLTPQQTLHALGIAATRTSGLKSQFGTMGKPYHAGMAASNGVEAALLAAAGFVSRPDGLECEQGFAQTHGGHCDDPQRILAGLGETFRFERVQHKFHACCHATHATLEALTEARDAAGLRPDAIEAVTIVVHPKWQSVCNLPTPATGLEAKFSYRLTAAMVLNHVDTGSLDTFSDAICADQKMLALRDRVRVETDPGMPDTAARVRIARRGDTTLEAAHDLEQPMPIAARQQRVARKATSLLGEHLAESLRTAIAALNEHDGPDGPSRLIAIANA